jgi:hypothetical protein
VNGQAYTFADIVNITLGALYNFGPTDFPTLAKLLQALYTNSHSCARSPAGEAAADAKPGLPGRRFGGHPLVGVCCQRNRSWRVAVGS